MRTEVLTLGPVPPDEDCVQVGTPDYEMLANAECRKYAATILRTCGMPPAGTKVYVKWNPHDFGSYAEVAIRFDSELGEHYAFWVERNGPQSWDDVDVIPWKMPERWCRDCGDIDCEVGHMECEYPGRSGMP